MPVIFKMYDPIPLSFTRVLNGASVTGLTVKVVVQNLSSGAVLLASATLLEITPGLYVYNWTHLITTQTECIATYTVGTTSTSVFKEYFSIDDTIKQIQQEEGRAS